MIAVRVLNRRVTTTQIRQHDAPPIISGYSSRYWIGRWHSNVAVIRGIIMVHDLGKSAR
jgi:hypothetical protein